MLRATTATPALTPVSEYVSKPQRNPNEKGTPARAEVPFLFLLGDFLATSDAESTEKPRRITRRHVAVAAGAGEAAGDCGGGATTGGGGATIGAEGAPTGAAGARRWASESLPRWPSSVRGPAVILDSP
jgi:hypothetical protein